MAETQPASLYSVCHAIAEEHGLDETKVLATAAKQVPVSHNAPPLGGGFGSSSALNRSGLSPMGKKD